MRQTKWVQRWLNERVAILLLWLGLLSSVAFQLLQILHWGNSLSLEIFASLTNVYVWSTLWKVTIASEPEKKLDFFFLLIILSVLPRTLGLFLLSSLPIWIVGLWSGMMVTGVAGIWWSKAKWFHLNNWLSPTLLLLHLLIFLRAGWRLIFEWGQASQTWTNRAQFCLSLVSYVMITLLLHRAANETWSPAETTTALIEEIGSEEPAP